MMTKLRMTAATALALGILGGAVVAGSSQAADKLNPEQERTSSGEREAGGGQAAPGQYTGDQQGSGSQGDTDLEPMADPSSGESRSEAMEPDVLNPEQERTSSGEREEGGGQAAPGQNTE